MVFWWISSEITNAVNPGKILTRIPPVLHQSDPNLEQRVSISSVSQQGRLSPHEMPPIHRCNSSNFSLISDLLLSHLKQLSQWFLGLIPNRSQVLRKVVHFISRTETTSFVLQSRKPSPCAVRSPLIHGNCVAKFCLYLRFLSCLKRRVTSYFLNLQGNSGVPGLLLSLRVSSYFHPELHLFAILDNSTLRIDWTFLLQISLYLTDIFWKCLQYPQAFWCNRILHSRRICRDKWAQVHRRLWLCRDPVFSFLLLHPFSPSGQAEILRAAT